MLGEEGLLYGSRPIYSYVYLLPIMSYEQANQVQPFDLIGIAILERFQYKLHQ